jgi:hypothetical protein
MVRTTLLVAVLFAPLPVFAQSPRVYTNADLGQKAVTWQRTVTSEEWAGIVERRFIPPPEMPVWGPSVYVIPWAGDAIPATPSIFGSSSYADSLWRDPVSAYALEHPIEAAYGYRHRYGSGFNRSPRSHVTTSDQSATRSAAAPPPVAAPSVVTHALGAGRRVR